MCDQLKEYQDYWLHIFNSKATISFNYYLCENNFAFVFMTFYVVH